MGIDIDQLEINVNLHALQPDFLNSELYYVIARGDKSFRFANWDDEPEEDEEKFYCFLVEEELLIPAGNILLKQSYVLKEEPIYPAVSNTEDFVETIKSLAENVAAKRIRRFYDEDIDVIKEGLAAEYGSVEKHVVTSLQGRHLLFLLDSVEISVSATMVYFRFKTRFNETHYEHVKEEKEGK